MGVYNLTLKENVYSELKAMVAADSNLSIEYDDGVDDLVVHHSGVGVYIEFDDVDNLAPKIWGGISWTSGELLNDRYRVANVLTFSMEWGKIITGANFITICVFDFSSRYYVVTLTKLSNGDVVCVGGQGTDDAYYTGNSYNFSLGEVCSPLYLLPLLTPNIDNAYCTLPIYLESASTIYTEAGVPCEVENFKIMLKPANVELPIDNAGTDLIINLGTTIGEVNITKVCLLGEGLYQ